MFLYHALNVCKESHIWNANDHLHVLAWWCLYDVFGNGHWTIILAWWTHLTQSISVFDNILLSYVAHWQLDRSKIEVIKWLVYDEDQREEAIRQGNALMRQFLGWYSYLNPSLIIKITFVSDCPSVSLQELRSTKLLEMSSENFLLTRLKWWKEIGEWK